MKTCVQMSRQVSERCDVKRSHSSSSVVSSWLDAVAIKKEYSSILQSVHIQHLKHRNIDVQSKNIENRDMFF